jgi:hypothetical protein
MLRAFPFCPPPHSHSPYPSLVPSQASSRHRQLTALQYTPPDKHCFRGEPDQRASTKLKSHTNFDALQRTRFWLCTPDVLLGIANERKRERERERERKLELELE